MSICIYILCGDATYNRGDRGNLCAQIDLLRSRFPDAHIVVDSYRPECDRVWYNAEVIRRGLFLSLEQIKKLRKADVVVWGGGALLADNASRIKIPYWVLVIGFIKWVLRKPIMVWAQGLVIDTKMGATLSKVLFNWTDLITTRDENSFKTLQRIGATRQQHFMTADPAVLVQASSPKVGRHILETEGVKNDGKPLFVITNTFCPFHYNKDDIIPYMIARPLGLRRHREQSALAPLMDALSRIADLLIKKYDCKMLFIPTYPAPWENDVKYFQDISKRATHRDRIFILKGDSYSPNDYLSLWHHFDFVLTIPLHHSIFSTAMKVPCVNLYYESKGLDFFRAIDAKDRMLDVNCLYEKDGPERVLEIIDYTVSNWDSLLVRTRTRFETIQDRARQNADHLVALMEKRGILNVK